MAVFIDQKGEIFFNALIGFPGDQSELLVYRLGATGYQMFRVAYSAGLLFAGLVLIATVFVALSGMGFASKQIALLLLFAIDALIVVGLMSISLVQPRERISLSHCVGERKVSCTVYLCFLSVFISGSVGFLEQKMYFMLISYLSAGIYAAMRLVVWNSKAP